MEEAILYIWCLSETRSSSVSNRTRFPARSTHVKDLSSGMELADLFENEYFRDALGSLKLEEVGDDHVTISYRGDKFTVRKGERHTTPMFPTDNAYLSEYMAVEVELS